MNFWEKSFGDRIYHLDYELLTKSEEEIQLLIKYLNLDWEKDVLNHKIINELSASNYHQKKNAKAVHRKKNLDHL